MDRPPIFRSLEQQNARSFGKVRVVLYQFRSFYTFDKFPRKQSVGGQLVVSVFRNSEVALGDQRPDAVKRLARSLATPHTRYIPQTVGRKDRRQAAATRQECSRGSGHRRGT